MENSRLQLSMKYYFWGQVGRMGENNKLMRHVGKGFWDYTRPAVKFTNLDESNIILNLKTS